MKDYVTKAYFQRFGKNDGVDAWMASAVAKPFVDPTTPGDPGFGSGADEDNDQWDSGYRYPALSQCHPRNDDNDGEGDHSTGTSKDDNDGR